MAVKHPPLRLLYCRGRHKTGFSLKNGETSQMLKIILFSVLAFLLVVAAIKAVTRLRASSHAAGKPRALVQHLLQNPIVRAILVREIWRLIRLFIFKR
jgi:hypothetical protein